MAQNTCTGDAVLDPFAGRDTALFSAASRVYLNDNVRLLPELATRGAPRAKLLLTSPPYFGVTNYHYDQWLRLWLLGGRTRYEPRVSIETSLNTEPSTVISSNSSLNGQRHICRPTRQFTFAWIAGNSPTPRRRKC